VLVELLRDLLPAMASGAVCGLIAWGGMRADLRHARRDAMRAHKRLDLIGAPNFTLDDGQ
jgi:hypothetical protein